ncbi:MAG: histidinol-phosphatase [Mycobacteriales bacterium]
MPAASSYADDLSLAHLLADDADSITMSRFRAGDLRVDTKPDMTPVTDADTTVERVLRGKLEQVRRRDAVLGEEMGRSGSAARCWVIDPIDGTKNFVRGVPVWATLIALMDDDEVVAGVVSAPALNRRWWAARGTGAYTGKSMSSSTPCHVSRVTAINDASLSYSSIGGWRDADRLQSFLDLEDRVWRARAYSDFWSYMLVAEGAVDVACEPEVSLWDLAALAVIVEESGGRFTALDGTRGPSGGSAVATNGLLHDEVLGLIGG